MSADLIGMLVNRIAALQSTGDAAFAPGLFPARRVYPPTGGAVDDDSIFPTAVVVYILSTLADRLPAPETAQIAEICNRAIRNYRSYLSPGGDKIYNFWQTTPDHRPFPNSRWKLRHRIFRLPEDIDTTAYIYLTDDVSDEQAAWLKTRIADDTNLNTRAIRNTPPPYRTFRAYSTWLESVEMPVDFDVCALSNLLLFTLSKDLPLNEFDRESIRFIGAVIDNDDHIRRPFDVAPWYAETSLILYHVARLIGRFDVPGLTELKSDLLDDIRSQFGTEHRFMHRVLLSTAAIRLARRPLLERYPEDIDEAASGFSYFRGSPLAGRENPIAWRLARYSPFQVRFRCPALNLALVLEHEALRYK